MGDVGGVERRGGLVPVDAPVGVVDCVDGSCHGGDRGPGGVVVLVLGGLLLRGRLLGGRAAEPIGFFEA